MKILVLVAGTNDPSNCATLADAFIKGMQQAMSTFGRPPAELKVEKLHLKDLKIEHFTVDCYDPFCFQEEDFCRVQHLLEGADGVVIATPVWNFSVPAHLKNLIDRMGSFALDATRTRGTLQGKPFYLLFTTGAPRAAWSLQRLTTSHLPWSLQFFGGRIAGMYVEGGCVRGKGKFGLVVDARANSLTAVRQRGERFALDLHEGRIRHHGNLLLTIALKVQRLQNLLIRVAWGGKKGK